MFAKRDATQNLRYKFGEDLRAENPEYGLLFNKEDALKLPRRARSEHAPGDGRRLFVYPTKLREYQSRYRGSFLHGGVTPEECILPVSLLTPRRWPCTAGCSSFLRPHAWRLTGNIVSSVVAAVLDAFMFTLPHPVSECAVQSADSHRAGWLGSLQQRLIGQFLDANDKLGSLAA